jgi:hypothetical protein
MTRMRDNVSSSYTSKKILSEDKEVRDAPMNEE